MGEVGVVGGVGGVRETRASNVASESSVGGRSIAARGKGERVGVREVQGFVVCGSGRACDVCVVCGGMRALGVVRLSRGVVVL